MTKKGEFHCFNLGYRDAKNTRLLFVGKCGKNTTKLTKAHVRAIHKKRKLYFHHEFDIFAHFGDSILSEFKITYAVFPFSRKSCETTVWVEIGPTAVPGAMNDKRQLSHTHITRHTA